MRGRGSRPRILPRARIALVLVPAVVLASCAPRTLTLPTGASTPLPDAGPFRDALAHCTTLPTVTAEIGLSGRAAGQRLRGTLHAGFAAPASVRLEAVAPFGGPFFLLAGTGGRATLLLPREDRVLRDAQASDILAALSGVDQTPGDLHAWIAGCPAARGEVQGARSVGEDWAAADMDGDRQIWIVRAPGGGASALRPWRLAAVIAGPLTVEFAGIDRSQPRRLRLRRASAPGIAALDLTLTLRQVERGVELSGAAFVLDVPDGATPITLEELRASGPLREKK